jgi:hypothetical protein
VPAAAQISHWCIAETAILVHSLPGAHRNSRKGFDLEIQNGKLQGNQLSFDATTKVNGETYRLHYSGVIKSDSITLRGEVNGKKGGPELIFHRSAN